MEAGEIKAFNADKQIAEQRDLPLVLDLLKAFRQTSTGETLLKLPSQMTPNERIINRVKGLLFVIQSIRGLIRLGRGRIKNNCFNKWKFNNNKEKPNFEDEDNDYNNLIYYERVLKECEQEIIKADRTKSVEDDFLIKKIDNEGEESYDLTDNYFEMLDVLDELWSEVEILLYKNKILSQGMIEDEILTHEQIAQEFKNRIVNS